MAKLVVLTEGFAGRSYDLKGEKTTIGRVEDNAFQIPEPSVSSHHCEIQFRGADCMVRDLDSTNGTFINGERVKEAALKPGQVLQLGGIQLRFEDEKGAAAKPKQVVESTHPGVKLSSLEPGAKPANLPTDALFRKKSNKINLAFTVAGIVLGVIVVGLLLWAIIRAG
ncbi:MAG TPA: FHA domain-containing protein [Candidatus Paceibacterota bacterium]|nr:FHA domain-containing protein [Verrucomicrobiota bacterium]HOX02284.1 FHA domain-containing protein [Verrucomicrobiota bacterium]HRZ45076.1 FHA domain-containing protein [Candidatus Paceibacterota bacterium]HRZ94291.1 FHA domain-containing protein [Candidatus Paceibacterota bacterium]